MKQTDYGVRTVANAGFRLILLLVMMLIAGGVAVSAQAATVYVNSGATGANDGSSWANAYTDLQTALASATAGDEIWVAAGVYKPGTDRGDSFVMKNGVALYGGFPATGNPGMADRNWEVHKTILSGDIDNNDTNTDGNFIAETHTDIQGANSYHVVKSSGTDSTAILDGFIITAGKANGSSYLNSIGGGMYNDNSRPAVSNCTFSGNSAKQYGGGMYNEVSRPTVSNCTFTGNSAEYGHGGGMYNKVSRPTVSNCTFTGNFAPKGGGIYNTSSSSSTVNNCIFTGNSASKGGGGMYNKVSSPTVSNCIFNNNSASTDGGGMSNNINSNPAVSNCIFSGNFASKGGGMYNYYYIKPTVNNCTFSGNYADSGGGMYNLHSSSPAVNNCTFSGNSASKGGGGMYNEDSRSTVVNCTFSGNYAEIGGGMCTTDCNLVVTDCVFFQNAALSNGGGMYNDDSSPKLSNCTFTGNSTNYDGGGMYNNDYSSPTMNNCIFSGNSASKGGGGMYNTYRSNPTVSNCTFTGNSAKGTGGGMYNDDNSNPTLANCIFWNNSSEIESGGTGTVSVSYSIVQGGFAGTGNIDQDPLFVTPVDPSAAPTTAGDLHLQPGSPAIDAGNNSALPPDTGDADGDGNTTEAIDVDADGNPRITDGVTDMGAYEVLFKTVITGLPSGTTGSTSASATVGGDGIAAYKYKLDNGIWSAEIPVGTPVSLSDLSDGAHTLYVIGKKSDGIWQPESQPSAATWTVLILPIVTTSPVSNVSATSATCGGHVSYDGSGSLLSRGICWDTSPEPHADADPHTGNGAGLGDFISQISSLQPETAYYVRAYASVKTDGLTYTVYGEQFTFTTPKESLPGDVNDDEAVDLSDAVLALRILAGIDIGDIPINPDADVNGDGRIGIAEVIYILRVLSE